MSPVDVEISSGVATVTLVDPDRRNAMGPDMSRALIDALERIEADDAVGAVVVTGAPPAFCAGADLSHLTKATADGLREAYSGFLRVGRCPLPTIAAVNGPAVGAGMNLALVCDVRVAGRSARFDARFLQLGIHPGGGHTWMLNRLAGPQTAAAMVLFGEVLDGEAAVAAGLAWRCTEDDDLVATAQKLAARAAAVPRALARRAKVTLTEVVAVATHGEAVERELVDQAWSVTTPEFAERLAAVRARITSR